MSHITTMALVITDLAALGSAVQELGAEFIQGVTTFKSYQSGLTCEHKIRLPGCNYEIGVKRDAAGFTAKAATQSHYKLAFDFYGEGQKLKAQFGEGCKKIAQMYAVHKATAEARRKGYTVRREVGKNGNINLKVAV